MNEELKNQLKGYGLTDEQIVKIGDLGVSTADDMQFVQPSDLVDLGVRVIVARKIVAVFVLKPVEVPTPAAPATPTGPQTIVVKTGKPEDMSLRELVQAVSDGERSPDYVSALRKHVGGRRLFVRKPGEEKLDVDSTLELIDHVGDDRTAPEFWGDQPTETLDEILERRAMANPMTGEKLAKGDPWMGVSEERRVLAAYARLANHLSGNEDEYTLIKELRAEKIEDRWTRIQAAFTRAEKAHDPIVDQARAALYYRKGARPGTAAPFRRDTF